jgi:PASTA domain
MNVTLENPECWGHNKNSECSGYSKKQKKQKSEGCWGHSKNPGCQHPSPQYHPSPQHHPPPQYYPPPQYDPPPRYIPPIPQQICIATVPNLVNRTEHQARQALTAVGLVLGNDPAGNSKIVSQVPLAGTLLRCGWAVTVTVYVPPPPPPAPVIAAPPPLVPPPAPVVPPLAPVVPPPAHVALAEPTPWLWPVFTALVLLTAGLLVWLLVLLAIRARKGRKWVHAHVRAVVGAAPDVDVEVMESRTDYSPRSCVVRLEPRADSGTQVLEELHR